METDRPIKIILPDFMLPVMEKRVRALTGDCEILTIDQQGEVAGDPAGTEIVMLPWDLPEAKIRRVVTLPTVRWVQTVTAGVDRVAAALPADRTPVLTNAQGVFDVPIAEMVLAYMLVIAKRVPDLLAQQRDHMWHMLRLLELSGMTAGIVGLGSIGSEVARRCKALGMRVLATRRHPGNGSEYADEVLAPDRLSHLLAASHFVVIAAPLTPETRAMIGAPQLREMRDDAWLINIARGGIVDQPALVAALRERWIAGAALDVFDEEPLPDDSPLWDMENVIVTPHNAWSTPHFKEREAELFLDNLARYLRAAALYTADLRTAGLRNVVDPHRGY
jgi:phosphoglycerate dehydrogenase-like enzyme